MKKVCCQLSPFSHTHKNGETRARTKFESNNESQDREVENERIRFLLERQKEQILADVRN